MSRGTNHEQAWAAPPLEDEALDEAEATEERGPPASGEYKPFEPIEALCAEEDPESQLTD